MKYSSTNLSLNQILFEFCTCEVLNLIWINELNIVESVYSVFTNKSLMKSTSKCVKLVAMNEYKSAHIDVKNAIVFAAIQIKHYYNKTHQSHFFKSGNMINLQLHCEYILSEILNKKLEQQFIDSIQVLEQIDCLVYQLDISHMWKIHNVIFIAHLKSGSSKKDDSYCWSCFSHSEMIIILNDESDWELECLLWKWIYCKSCKYITDVSSRVCFHSHITKKGL